MRLNSLKPAPGARKKGVRVGRGIGSGLGKTSGRGHKGQTSRSGYSAKKGFEGGQMPLQRRIPKSGFRSRSARFIAEIPLSALNKVDSDTIDLAALHAAKLVGAHIASAKIILSGSLTKAVSVNGIKVTAGARQAIEAAGGKVE